MAEKKTLYPSKGFEESPKKEFAMERQGEIKEVWFLVPEEKFNTKGTNVNGKWYPFHIKIMEETCIRNRREYKIID